MAVSKARKEEQLALLESHLKEATSVAFTSNQKITVLEVSNLKKDLRATNALLLTIKKTLIRIAFKNVYGVEIDLGTLPGQVSLVIAKGDAIAPLGVANKYSIEWRKEEKLTFVGGYMDGRLMDGAETKKLATLPSREVLLAKLLGSMMSPLSGLARFFDAAGKDLTSKGLTKVSDLTLPTKEAAPIEPSKSEETAVPVEAVAEEAPQTQTPAQDETSSEEAPKA